MEATATVPKAGMLDGLRIRSQLARQIADGALATTLIGTGANERARKFVKVGATTAVVGTAGVGALSFTGYIGPAVMGVAILPLAAKVTIAAGIGTMMYGFVEGFRDGWQKSKAIKSVSIAEAVEAAQAAGKIVDVTETTHVIIKDKEEKEKTEGTRTAQSEHLTG